MNENSLIDKPAKAVIRATLLPILYDLNCYDKSVLPLLLQIKKYMGYEAIKNIPRPA